MHVLHVDDEVGLLETTKQILEMSGPFQVETVSSVEEAMKKLDETEFDAVISDYQMPKKDGLEFLRELRESGNNIPFILFTGKGREEVAIEALNLGADQYINKVGKPKTIYGELSYTITRIVNQRKIKNALQVEQERLETVTKNMSAGLAVISKDFRILWANNVLKDVFGDDYNGKICYALINQRKSACPGCGVKEIFEKGKDQHVHEQLVKGLDGQDVWLELVTTSIRDSNGNITAALELVNDITERKKAEETLNENIKKYRVLVEQSLQGMLVLLGSPLRFVFANRAMSKILGYTVDELTSLSPEDITGLIHPEDRQFVLEQSQKRFAGKKVTPHYEFRMIKKNGEICWLEMFCARVDYAGKPALQATFIDVTERKKMEQELKKSEEKYKKLFEGALDAIFLADPETGVILDCNLAATELVGRTKSELIGAHQRIIHPPEDLVNDVTSDFKRHREGKIKRIEKTQIITKDGQIKDVLLKASEFEVNNKKILQGTFRDITESKRAKENLEKSEKEKAAVLDSMSELVIHQDLEHRILWTNRQATISADITAEQIQGSYCYKLWANRDNPCACCPIEATIKTGKPQQGEMTTPDGRVWSISGSPIKDVNNKVTSVVEVTTEITEQKKTEDALRESKKKYIALLDGMNDTVWVIDFNGNIIDVNDSAVELLGYSKEEFRSIGLTGIDSNLAPEQIKDLVEAMQSDKIQVFETKHTTKDGKNIPVEISSSLVTYHGKQAILSIARNITERKQAVENLRQSEENYRTVFENTGTAMCILEADKTISMVNKQFETVSGYSWKELKGKKWSEFITQEYLERMQRYHEARRKKGKEPPTHYNFDFVNKKGQIRNCLLTIKLIPGTKKSVASVLDITEQKKTENSLKAAEEKYRETIVNSNVGIICYSPDGEVKVINPKMEQMTGFKRAEIPTLQDWFKKLYPNEKERYQIRDNWFKKMSKKGEVKEGHAIITTKDGKLRNFLFNGVQLDSGDSIAFAEDITEHKEAEEKLHNMMDNLVAINEKMGVVGRLTRHDVQNKLTVILNNVYLAKQRLTGDQVGSRYLESIESTVNQAEKIFDFARTYEMIGVEKRSYIDAEKSIEEAVLLFSDLGDTKLENECRGLAVLADSQLRQLFYNLIDNSITHGEKVTKIRIYYEEDEDVLKLIYEDNGVGIPENEKVVIFNDGYGKGTGYGLYLIQKICESYGWTIKETGTQGKGAQFTITAHKKNSGWKLIPQP